MRASLSINVSVPITDCEPAALASLQRFARWVEDPANRDLVFASLYRRWAAWSEDPEALERLHALGLEVTL